MTSSEICTVNDYCIDPADHETDFSDDDSNGDWEGMEIVTNEEDLITKESADTAQLIIQTYRKECWQCTRCNTINNIRQCIKKHGSKCVGCKTKCYIESQTPVIMRSEYHSNDELYRLQIEQLWQCESCLNINDKSISNCTKCDKPSPMTITGRKIKKFTKEDKVKYLIHGFVRKHEYYLEITYGQRAHSLHSVLYTFIQNYYVIDYLEAGWVLGNIKCMSIIKASNLKVGDKLDHRHEDGKFEPAEVKRIDTTTDESKSKLFSLKYKGRTYSLLSWCNYNEDPLKFAEAGAVSARPAHRLTDIKVGDQVDINPIFNAVEEHRGWKDGKIKTMDSKSGQVEVEYKYKRKNHTYWTHLDNKDEIDEYGSMTGHTDKTLSDMLRDDIEKQERAKGNLGYQW